MKSSVFKHLIFACLFISISINAQIIEDNKNNSKDNLEGKTRTLESNDWQNIKDAKAAIEFIKNPKVNPVELLLEPNTIGSKEHDAKVRKEIEARRNNSLEQIEKDKARVAKIKEESDDAKLKQNEKIAKEKKIAAKRAKADRAARELKEHNKVMAAKRAEAKRAAAKKEKDRGRSRGYEREIRSRSAERNERDSRSFDERYNQG